MARVSTIGELTASLAHELNQPLAAIVANAQAARRLYANNGRSADELPAVLNDIVDDGIRAGAVIQRTREMLRKETPSLTRLDLGALVRDVAVLVTNDALIRQVTLRLSLPHAPVFVDGDRHMSELMRAEREGVYPLYELTSSPIANRPFVGGLDLENPIRIGGYAAGDSYGVVELDTTRSPGRLTFRIMDAAGNEIVRREVSLDELRFDD